MASLDRIDGDLRDRLVRALEDPTDVALAEMVTASTGRHVLDSGGAYGRHWELNRRAAEMTAAAFGLEGDRTAAAVLDRLLREPADLDLRYGWVEITLDVWHWLRDRVEYLPEADERWVAWATTGDREDDHWLACAERFVAELEWADDVQTVNTYNGEDWLSQTLQWVSWSQSDDEVTTTGALLLGGEDYVLMQVHNGADVRGGYTRPYLFRCSSHEGVYSLYEVAAADVGCTVCPAGWDLHPHGVQYATHGTDGQARDLTGLGFADDDDTTARHIVRAVLAEHGEDDLLVHFPPLLTGTRRCPSCGEDGALVASPPWAG